MDPNAALRYLDRHPEVSEDTEERAEALHGWLLAGGFAPNWLEYPKGTFAYFFLHGYKSDIRFSGNLEIEQ